MRRIPIALIASLGLLLPHAALAQIGIAPTGDPGGFGIDRDPTAFADTTDWVPSLITPAGAPSSTTGSLHDEFPELSITGGGTKWINGLDQWRWTTLAITPKFNIHHVMTHFSHDAGHHLWFTWGATRGSTGDWTLAIELLQNDLVRNGDGTFSGSGPDHQKTHGDLLLIISPNDSFGTLSAFRWGTVAADSDGYTQMGSGPTSFLVQNIDTVHVSYPAFVDTVFSPRTFIEGAQDLELLAPGTEFHTVLFVSQSSISFTATLIDFAGPVRNLAVTDVPLADPPKRHTIAIHPNPGRQRVSIEFENDHDGPARIEIFDIAGRRIGSIDAGTITAGRHAVPWDSAAALETHGPGVFLVRVAGAASTPPQRFVLLR